MPTTNAEKARKLAERIAAQVRRAAGRGLNAARLFLESRYKEALSVPAPRKAVRERTVISVAGYRKVLHGAILYYRATTAATPGAPMRKLSGRARAGVTSVFIPGFTVDKAIVGLHARSDKGFNYPFFHEVESGGRSGQHPGLEPTVQKYRAELRVIIGREFRGEMQTRR